VRTIKIGEVTIDAVIEREGPWRRPQDFFPAYDEATFKRHLQVMEPEVFDPVSCKVRVPQEGICGLGSGACAGCQSARHGVPR
jgi:hypothetical protein